MGERWLMVGLADIFRGFGEGILGGANGLVKSIFGSAEGREEAAHAEQMTVMQQFMAEFGPRENRTWWDSLVDGLNRLPRPAMTFGVIYIFWYCIDDPPGFAAAMEALKLMPEYGWASMATIIVFWFGGKFMEKRAQALRVVPPDPDTVEKVLGFYERREAVKSKTASEWENPDAA